MKRSFILIAALALSFLKASAVVDPNFHIYLCFGQSNMEGNAAAESVDKSGVDSRFRMLATTDFTSPRRTMGQWYTATPPIVSPQGGLGMADYFGRTMAAALPPEVKVGVVDVAIGGCAIQMFDKDKYKTQLTDPSNWSAQLANRFYGGNPYKRLIDMAKIAQESGVIKGILLHQGCSNNGDPNWPGMVKKIYNDILTDLGLGADSIPLFVGETLRQENGGACYGHNTQVARMPSVIPNSYVISSEGCPGNGKDPWHFNATGYRIMGKRYAFKALQVMGLEPKANPANTLNTSLSKFFTAKSLDMTTDFEVMPGQKQRIPVTATFYDGHSEDVTNYMQFVSDDITFSGRLLAPQGDEHGTAEAVYTDFTGKQLTKTINVDVNFFPLKKDCITKLAGTIDFDEAKQSLKLSAGAQAGWVYDKGVDLSAYKYLVIKLKEPQSINAQVRLYASKSISTLGYRDTINERTTISIDLHNLQYNAGKIMDPTKIFMLTLRCTKAGTLLIDKVFLTNDDAYAPTGIQDVAADERTPRSVYSLQGIKASSWNQLRPGIYVVDGKLVRKP